MKDENKLIITGGNHQFFPYLQVFVRSLRNTGAYDGKVVICDNTIGGEWNNPGSYANKASFTAKERSFFNSHNVRIRCFHELVDDHGITRDSIESIQGGTTRYPYKFVYTTLIAKEHLDEVDQVCYFDADVYFQKPVKSVFERIEDEKISVVSEEMEIGETKTMSSWVKETDLSFGSDQSLFLKKMNESKNFCTGFFGADAATFNKFTMLCWMLASNRLTEFYSDQPLANILLSFFNFPMQDVGKGITLHLDGIPREELYYEEGKLAWKEFVPAVIHFNGGKGDFYDKTVEALSEGGGTRPFISSKSKRMWLPIKRRFQKWRQSSVLDPLRPLYRRLFK